MSDASSGMDKDTRNRILLYGSLGIVVIGAGAFLLMRGNGSADDSSATVGTPVTPRAATAASAAPSGVTIAVASPSPTRGALAHDPFQVPKAFTAGNVDAAASVPAAPSLTPGALTPSDLAALSAAGYTVTQSSGSPSPGASGSTSASPSASKKVTAPAVWIQLLAAHRQSDGTYTVDVRSATGVQKGLKPGAVNVGGTHLAYLGEDDSLGQASYVFTVSPTVGVNLVPSASVPAYTGKLTTANQNSTAVYVNGVLSGGLS